MTNEQKKELELLDSKINKFLEDNVRCETCRFCDVDLFSQFCFGPELELGELKSLDSCCEQHSFWDKKKEKELNDLLSRHAEIITEEWPTASR